jgi:biotin-dependent carboxylase-like uncharacterized protein
MLEVVRPGPLTTVQDLGRPGYAHLGVSPSGALDAPAARRANRIVGNPVEAACLEITLGGLTLRTEGEVEIAVTGAPGPVRIGGTVAATHQSIAVRAGELIEIGNATSGLRRYLAVRGGIDVPPVLGSRSRDVLGDLGPAPLRAGDRLPIGTGAGLREPAGEPESPVGGPVLVRAMLGPRDDWFTDPAVLGRSAYRMSPLSNRVGARLTGPALTRAITRELPSEGLVTGAVQVPADGQPLIFLNDHPTTGGYPVIAVVDRDDLPLIAQARPGTQVRFRLRPADHGGLRRAHTTTGGV